MSFGNSSRNSCFGQGEEADQDYVGSIVWTLLDMRKQIRRFVEVAGNPESSSVLVPPGGEDLLPTSIPDIPVVPHITLVKQGYL